MIVVCEPQCKAFSHEKFNSGFLYGLRLAFPSETLRVYGDTSHIEALKMILIHDKVSIGNIEYAPVWFRTNPSLIRALGYRSLLARVFREALDCGTDRVFFLSFNPEILYAIKRLKRDHRFRNMKFALVLHGGFEDIAGDSSGAKAAVQAKVPFQNEGLLAKLRRTKPGEVPLRAAKMLIRFYRKFTSPWRVLSRRVLSERKMLLWRHSSDFRYICLSPHIRRNASRYLDVERLNIHTVVLPVVFANVVPRPRNQYVKFAVFGYGDSLALYNVLVQLSQRRIEGSYEIRVIGMDSRGIDGFPHITCPSPGRPLERSDMERYALDIDMFLILYDKSRYRLSCSGSILEALSYLKPVLYLDNECINYFSSDSDPIGIRCDSFDQLAAMIKQIAERYEEYGPVFDAFRSNMLKVRTACAIERSVDALRNSFTW